MPKFKYNFRKYLISSNMLIFDSYAIIFQHPMQSKVPMQSTSLIPPDDEPFTEVYGKPYEAIRVHEANWSFST